MAARARGSAGGSAALDTSCVIALVCAWHERHAWAVDALEEAIRAGARLVVPSHTLVESYAVLTRLPSPHRLAPADALRLLRDNFGSTADTIALSARETWELLESAVGADVSGGRTYDALVAAAARRAGATVLYTLNPRHFAAFEPGGPALRSP